MRKVSFLFRLLLLVTVMSLSACDGGENSETDQTGQEPATGDQSSENASTDHETTEDASTDSGGGIDAWLEMVKNGEVTAENSDGSFDWGDGYLVYYGSIEDVGVDNLIYNAQIVNRRLDTGEVTSDSLSPNEQNLLALTDGIEFDPAVAPEEQIAQTSEIRDAILQRISQSQEGMSPDEALASNETIGIIALPAPDAIGGKYLVYTQDTPDADFNFLGVVIVTDAISPESASTEAYNFEPWQDLSYLGDATGPFWNEIPVGVSGDPANTDEGRPGVLLISESKYEEIK